MRTRFLIVVVCLFQIVTLSLADIVQGIDIDFVTIGNAGNAANTTGYGAVGYNYSIGKHEITNAQWNTFVSAAGAPTGNNVQGYNPYDEPASYTGLQQPVNFISWYEAAQFCNYLTTGDKSKGVYQFSGDNTNPGNLLNILNHGTAGTIYGTAYFIPTENEWCKAAYYDPTLNSGSGGYWDYPSRSNSDTPPTAGYPPGSHNSANYNGVIGNAVDVGSYTLSGSAYGTFDQGGNLWEWNEDLFGESAEFPAYNRVLRGGSWFNYSNGAEYLLASYRSGQHTESSDEDATFGFRVASIPEPATLLLVGLGGLLLRRRKK